MKRIAVVRVAGRMSLVVMLGLGLLLSVGAGEARAEGDLEWDTVLTYRLDAEHGSIGLVSDITVTNRQPNSREGNTIIQYYFDRIGIYIPVEAEEVTVTSDGRDLAYEISEPDDEQAEAEGFELVEIRLARKLFYKRSTEVRVEYSIPGDAPRSDSVFRINPAYASFGVSAWGDPGRIEVRVIVDEAFDVSAFGSAYEVSSDGSDVIYTMTDIDDPSEWFMLFTARNDAKLETETLVLGGYDIVVRSWPGDSVWGDEVEATITTGVPVLQELVGLEWRPQEDLTVLESIEPNVLGYGGWYLDTTDLVEIGEYVDPHLVLHEIAHTWFNDDLFEERWITEGLADEFAAATVDQLGERSWYELDTPARNGPYSFALNEWPDPSEFDRKEAKREDYGYQTSWWIMSELVDEIGMGGLSAVIAAADADSIAYRGEGTSETVDPSDDWQRFLDLLEEVGESENASDLFAEWVVAENDLLASRTEARTEYAALVDSADGWSIPFMVRTHMSDWDFEAATAAMQSAHRVIQIRDNIHEHAAVIDAVPPASLEAAFESATEDLTAVQDIAEQQLATAQLVVDTQVRVEDERNPLEVIGLIGEHPDEELDAAVEAFEADDLGAAEQASETVSQRMENADTVGISRVLKTAIGLVLLIGLVVGLVVWRRRRHTAGRDDLEEAAVSGDQEDVAM